MDRIKVRLTPRIHNSTLISLVLALGLGAGIAYLWAFNEPVLTIVLMGLYFVGPIFLLIIIGTALYKTMTPRGALPFLGTTGLVIITFLGSVFLGLRVAEKIQIHLCATQIEEARAIGQDVKSEDVTITLGPPTIARFHIPTMYSSWQEIVYDDSDATLSGEQDIAPCYRSIRPLGNHFYMINGTC